MFERISCNLHLRLVCVEALYMEWLIVRELNGVFRWRLLRPLGCRRKVKGASSIDERRAMGMPGEIAGTSAGGAARSEEGTRPARSTHPTLRMRLRPEFQLLFARRRCVLSVSCRAPLSSSAALPRAWRLGLLRRSLGVISSLRCFVEVFPAVADMFPASLRE